MTYKYFLCMGCYQIVFGDKNRLSKYFISEFHGDGGEVQRDE